VVAVGAAVVVVMTPVMIMMTRRWGGVVIRHEADLPSYVRRLGKTHTARHPRDAWCALCAAEVWSCGLMPTIANGERALSNAHGNILSN
jgi:hypothetical protein